MIEFLLGVAVLVACTGYATGNVLRGIAVLKRTQAEAKSMTIMASAYRMQEIRKGEPTMFGKNKKNGKPTTGTAIVPIADYQVHQPDDPEVLPLALRNGPAPDEGTHYRTVGRQVLMVRPEIEIDLSNGAPGRGMTERRIAGWILASMEHDLGVGMSDVCDVHVADCEGRFAVVRVHNHSTEASTDLAIPVQPVSGELDQTLQTYRDGVLLMSGEAHKKRQNLPGGQQKIGQALAMLERLKNDGLQHATRAEYLLLETVMKQAHAHGARIPYAEPATEQLDNTWLVKKEEQVDGGHQVLHSGDTRRQGIAVEIPTAARTPIRSEPTVKTFK